MMVQGEGDDVVVIRRDADSDADDTSTGDSMGGIDAAGVSGASGAKAGTSGSPGTAIGSNL